VAITGSALGGLGLLATAFDDPPAPLNRVALVLDASPTSASASRCDDATRIARQQLAASAGRLELAVLSSGDRTTGGEPVVLGTLRCGGYGRASAPPRHLRSSRRHRRDRGHTAAMLITSVSAAAGPAGGRLRPA
jgi:hypothetical protein